MNEFNNYYFIYKNSLRKWGTCTNPVFIAKHTFCRAIKKTDIKNINYLIKKLNSYNENRVTCFLRSKFNLY